MWRKCFYIYILCRCFQNVKAYVSPKTDVKILNDQSKANGDITRVAQCRALGGKPPAQVSWIFPQNWSSKQKVSVTTEINPQTPNLTDVVSTLQIASSHTNSQGNFEFKCQISHKSFNDSVHYSIVLSTPTDPQITFNKSLNQLTCSAEGNPPVKYTWILPKNTKAEGPTINALTTDDSDRQARNYTCMVENVLGVRTTSFILGSEKCITITKYIVTLGVFSVIVGVILATFAGETSIIDRIKIKRNSGIQKGLRNNESLKSQSTEERKLLYSDQGKETYHGPTHHGEEMKIQIADNNHVNLHNEELPEKINMTMDKKTVKSLQSLHKVLKVDEATTKVLKMEVGPYITIFKERSSICRELAANEIPHDLSSLNSTLASSDYEFVKHPEEDFIGISGWAIASSEGDSESHVYEDVDVEGV